MQGWPLTADHRPNNSTRKVADSRLGDLWAVPCELLRPHDQT